MFAYQAHVVGGREAHKIVGVDFLFMVARFRATPSAVKGCDALRFAILSPGRVWTLNFWCWSILCFGIGFTACFAWLLHGSLN